jgi:hypothetical protein
LKAAQPPKAKRLELALAIQSGGEGLIVEGALRGIGPGVGSHALDTVLGLVLGELSAKLIGSDVRLQ